MSLVVFEQRPVGPLACNCYIVGDEVTRRAIVIDPGGDAEDLLEVLLRDRLSVVAIVATHAHFDHLIAAERLREVTGAPFHMHRDDRPILDWYRESGRMFLGIELGAPPEVDTELAEGDTLMVTPDDGLQVLHTPGHSPGSISLTAEGLLFSGDTLFASGIGRSDLPGGSGSTLIRSIKEKLFHFDDDVLVLPGHGPTTTIGREKVSNPFVGR
ncbi:MAG: MBL fold metallo-hydrolase [Actinomycetota bacterium]